MYSSTFIFAKGQWDDEFHRLDEEIAQAAKATPGYLGEESWENPAQGLISNVYYWESLEALQALMRHPAHLQAKARQADWLDGYLARRLNMTSSFGAFLAGAANLR